MKNSDTDLQILSFYGWWEMSVCLFAFGALMAIWWHVGRNKKDYGQVWLALSVLCWSFSGLVEIVFAANSLSSADSAIDSEQNVYLIDGLRSIFSLLNSLFILLALPYFKYIPKSISGIIKSKYWLLIIGLPFVFSMLPTVTSMILKKNAAIISESDVYYGILTLGFLGLVLWESFTKRRLYILAFLSLICIAITFVSQILKLGDLYINTMLLSAIFKTNLIMIFFALALSWIKDITEVLNLDSSKMKITFYGENSGFKTFKNVIVLHGVSSEKSKVKLSRSQYNLIRNFASKKKEGEGWLEIKPKSEKRLSKSYDINDYNEIKRLTHGILDDLFGKEMWSKTQHETPLKTALFEFAEDEDRKIRLKIDSENISLN